MKYDIQPEGHLRITIQPTHELAKIFRKGVDAAVKYNLQENLSDDRILDPAEDDPIQMLINELHKDRYPYGNSIDSLVTDRMIIQTARQAGEYLRAFNPQDNKLERYKLDVYIMGKIIGIFLFERLTDAWFKLMYLSSDPHYKERIGDISRMDDLSNVTARLQCDIGPKLAPKNTKSPLRSLSKKPANYSILFEGGNDGNENVNPYLFDVRDP